MERLSLPSSLRRQRTLPRTDPGADLSIVAPHKRGRSNGSLSGPSHSLHGVMMKCNIPSSMHAKTLPFKYRQRRILAALRSGSCRKQYPLLSPHLVQAICMSE